MKDAQDLFASRASRREADPHSPSTARRGVRRANL